MVIIQLRKNYESIMKNHFKKPTVLYSERLRYDTKNGVNGSILFAFPFGLHCDAARGLSDTDLISKTRIVRFYSDFSLFK